MTISYEDDNLDDILNNTSKIGLMTRFASAIVAIGFIPGIGEVILTIAGVFLVGNVVVEVGSWLYSTIKDKFNNAKPYASNKSKSHWDKHTGHRSRGYEKKKGKSGWKSRH
ncbi:hypothetical protein PT285_00710 [Lactobacillus sp. ESL0791]|uniref:hypothetical protein n=1 Tax=Lactobacillus sp. ESL0791 TaxID=2983234 RepID=UPI0023F6D1CC|nr:hypothetical protein [Lactobacillus sp. ESL0791]MDF7637959.1 hypothetical protein [Lactobacillus sp. ESL0791]